jgi:hypothetical protein
VDAGSDFFTGSSDNLVGADALLAFGAVEHNLAGVDSAFGFNYSAGITLLAGSDVLGNYMHAFNDTFALFGRNTYNLANGRFFLIGAFTALQNNGVADFSMHLAHSGILH